MNNSYHPFQSVLSHPGLRYYGLTLRQQPPSPALRYAIHSYLQVTACALCPYPIIPDGTQALCGWDWLAAETKMLD